MADCPERKQFKTWSRKSSHQDGKVGKLCDTNHHEIMNTESLQVI